MRVGMGLALMNPMTLPDERVYEDALRLAGLAEPLGLESLWTVEHHFTGHSPIPNALHLLTYLAARTQRINLGTAVVVLPWHNPLRVAEEIAMLDLLSGGRAVIGFGRGSSAIEYAGFGIPQEEGHERLLEGIQYVKTALTEETFSYSGKFYSAKNLAVRPHAVHGPASRLHGAAHTERSAELVGSLGLHLLFSPEKEAQRADSLVAAYRSGAQASGHMPGKLTAHLYVSVADSRAEAVSRARSYMTPMVESLARHYTAVPGEDLPLTRRAGSAAEIEAATSGFMEKHVVGTPEECLSKIIDIAERYRIDRFVGEFSYGAMPYGEAEDNLRTFVRKVMPDLVAWR